MGQIGQNFAFSMLQSTPSRNSTPTPVVWLWQISAIVATPSMCVPTKICRTWTALAAAREEPVPANQTSLCNDDFGIYNSSLDWKCKKCSKVMLMMMMLTMMVIYDDDDEHEKRKYDSCECLPGVLSSPWKMERRRRGWAHPQPPPIISPQILNL